MYFIRPLGNGTLCFSELEEVVLDVEVALNNSPLSLVAETGKSGFRSPTSWKRFDSKAHYVVKSRSGIRSERKGGLLRHPFVSVKTRL